MYWPSGGGYGAGEQPDRIRIPAGDIEPVGHQQARNGRPFEVRTGDEEVETAPSSRSTGRRLPGPVSIDRRRVSRPMSVSRSGSKPGRGIKLPAPFAISGSPVSEGVRSRVYLA